MLQPAASVVVVEDEPVTSALLRGCLTAAGLAVTCFEGAQGLKSFAGIAEVDLVLLDIELADGDGFGLAEWVRARSEAGIIYLSRRADPRDRVRGLDLGGDDYIVKPPDIDELVSRVRAVLRRRRATPIGTRLDGWSFAGWRFDARRFELRSPEGAVAPLTQGEAGVLRVLVMARGDVVAREALNEALAVDGAPNPRSLDVLIHRLRKKLGEGGNVVPRVLLTVHGVGYRIGAEVTLGP